MTGLVSKKEGGTKWRAWVSKAQMIEFIETGEYALARASHFVQQYGLSLSLANAGSRVHALGAGRGVVYVPTSN